MLYYHTTYGPCSNKPQYLPIWSPPCSTSLCSMLSNLVNILITNTNYLAGGPSYLCISKYSEESQNGSYFTYWNSKADFIRGTIFSNDRVLSHAKGIPRLYAPPLNQIDANHFDLYNL